MQLKTDGKAFLAAEVLNSVLMDIQNKQIGGLEGLSTGLPRLDRLIEGFCGGQLYLLAGGPGVGKTTLAWQWACEIAKGNEVVYITYENSAKSLVQKALARLGRINLRDIKLGNVDSGQLFEAANVFRKQVEERLFVIEAGRGWPNLLDFSDVADITDANKTTNGLIIIDYLQKATHCLMREIGQQELRLGVAYFAAQMRALARASGCAVLALASQNRAGYQAGRDAAWLDTLKESGDLEYAADVVMFLVHSDRAVPPSAMAVDLVVQKNREGEVGMVPLTFRPDIACFIDTNIDTNLEPKSRKGGRAGWSITA